MGLMTIIDFIVISIPEQFLMALFAWVLLGRTSKLRNVFIVGLISAGIFLYCQTNMPSVSLPMIQALSFGLLIYLGYKLNILEAVGCNNSSFLFSSVLLLAYKYFYRCITI